MRRGFVRIIHNTRSVQNIADAVLTTIKAKMLRRAVSGCCRKCRTTLGTAALLLLTLILNVAVTLAA